MNSGKMLWAYRAVFTQTAGGGGNVVVRVTASERYELLYAIVGPDDYAANRNVFADVFDSGAKRIARMGFVDGDNVIIKVPFMDSSGFDTNDGTSFEKKVLVGSTDYIDIRGNALVQNETLTIHLRALIKTTKPVVDTALSSGTVTTTLTYDKVI